MARKASWSQFSGKHVELRKDGQLVRTGFVKDVLDSDEALWLEAERFQQRILIDKSMGFTIRPIADPPMNLRLPAAV
ncbi:hypothetical protein ACPROK_08440 [Glutamicibacter soli]|uniref:Uncharacterized protein n=1 Tax=Glutamicibacter soli TaxID=453836 RepID=A0A365YEN6_9MICC|nr:MULTISPECIES: hypothetical protein [Micrococcaceae]ALQ29295.1 hypothetical protein ATC04_01215 [Arthrobacter sp. YC-RL1]KLI89310.1 hypothetical protein AA310_16840 [Arthrobacter sp. YC-RL1]NAZ16287.1 hypothetical protein [Glutamicibacter soli]RBM01156.1 hypothetical protein C1H84_10260 [Glutamicibacter soli]